MILSWLRRPPPPPVITEARSGDAGALAAIHVTGFERGWDVAEFERLLADKHVLGHLARPGGRGIATGFALSRIVLDEAEILTVAVLPSARGAGLATAILNLHFGRLAGRGARTVFLEVAEDNAPAIKLYRRFGFAEVGRRTGYYARSGRPPASALVMRRPLG